MVARLPLFPLGTVLVPGATLPLQIFEPRYVALLADLLVDDGRDGPPEFGVVAIREGHEVGTTGVRALHDVGCVARLTRVATLGDQRYLVACEGSRRFRLEGLIEDEEAAPYAVGHVRWLDEPAGDPAALTALGEQLRDALTAFRRAVSGDTDELELPQDPKALSYAVTAAIDLDLADRQRLLEAPDTQQRLRLALRLVRRESGIADRLGAVVRPPDPRFNLN